MWPCGGTTGRSRGQKTSWLRTDPLLRGGAPVRLRVTLRRPCADGSNARHTTCDVPITSRPSQRARSPSEPYTIVVPRRLALATTMRKNC